MASLTIGNRTPARLLRGSLRGANLRALGAMARRYPDPWRSLWRYLTGRGAYPYACRVRTPIGGVSPTLHSAHDMLTTNEVFCREDYRVGADIAVAVDIGSNIGISALYFLTRSQRSRAYLYEPDPRNVERLQRNLQGFEGRYRVEQVAIDVADGEVRFSVEPSGRYGRIGRELSEQITARSRAINTVLADVLAAEGEIDVLKVDTEGTEELLVGAIEPAHLERIATIYYETAVPAPLHEDRFEHRFASETNLLRRR